MKKILVLSVLLLISLRGMSFAENDAILIKMKDGKAVTMSDFNRIISYYDEEKQKVLAQNPQFKATVLQRIMQGMVVARIAKDEGFDKKPEIREQIDLLANDLIASEYLKKVVIASINITDDDMKLYYKAHQEDFKTPEMVRAQHILVKAGEPGAEADKKKAKEKAEDILNRIKAGEDFAKLASEFSDDPRSKTRGGDLGLIPKGTMPPDFEKVAFSLNAGELSAVFETSSGFHIVKVQEKKAAVIEPYDAIKDKVREKVFASFRKARLDEFVGKAMNDAGVEMNLEPFLPKQ